MIYIAKKHSRKHIFPGDVDKEILQYYRDRKWKITLDTTRSIPKLEKTEPRPAPQGKTTKRRKRRLHKVKAMGRWVVIN